jgi:hypothetical protein
MLRLSTRVAAIAAMLAVTSLGSVALASGVASASAPKVTCTSFSTNFSGTGTVSGCTDTANTGGKGSLVTTASTGKGTITWAKKLGTTRSTAKDTVVTPDTKCNPKSDTEVKITDTVTGGTGKASNVIKTGQSGTFYVCANSTTKKVTLAPGQKFEI